MPEKYNRKYFVQKIFYDEDENSFKLHRSQNDDDGSYVHQINKALQTCNILGIKSLQDVKKIVINDTTCSRFAFLSYQYDGVEMSNKSHKVTNIDTLNYILQHDDDEFELIHLSINECVRAIICQNSKIKLNCAYPIAIDDFFTLGLLQFILLMKKDFE